MRKKKRSYKMYLEDIQQAMQKIIAYTSGLSFEAFSEDSKTTDAVIRNFQIIGEASKNVPNRIRSKYKEVPWLEMYHLRNSITHEYFGLDLEMIWDIAKNELPENLRQIDLILTEEF